VVLDNEDSGVEIRGGALRIAEKYARTRAEQVWLGQENRLRTGAIEVDHVRE